MSEEDNMGRMPSRRMFLRRGLLALAGFGLGGGTLPLVGCKRDSDELTGNGSVAPARSTASGGSVREIRLTASPGEVEVGAGRTYRTWLYNGRFPGPEIRVREGEQLRVTVDNDLPDAGTTVHWHGLPVPNAMDGVPGVTQDPIPPGESMIYEYEATPPGSYMYHSHEVLQLDRGLVGPLIIEERTLHVDYDREHVLILDDFLPEPPRPLSELAEASGEQERGGMMGGRAVP